MIAGTPSTPWYMNPKILLGVIGVLLVALLGSSYSSKKKLDIEVDSREVLEQAYSKQGEDYMRVLADNTSLKEQVSKEKNRAKAVRDYYENGLLKHEETDESSSSEARVSELTSQVSDLTRENSMLSEENVALKREKETKAHSEETRKGLVSIGAMWDFNSLKGWPTVYNSDVQLLYLPGVILGPQVAIETDPFGVLAGPKAWF